MQPEYKCPLCQSVISIDDVNVATDLALCRSCGKTSAFSMINDASGFSPSLLAAPPRCIRMEEDYMGGTRITYHRKSPILLFLIPFTAIWSGLSISGIYGTQIVEGEFDAGQSLFGLPFLAGTIVLVSAIVYLLAGKWVICLRDGEGSVFVGVGSLGRTRSFTYDRNTLVSLKMTNIQANNVPQKGILVRNGNEEFVFGTLLVDEAKRFVASAILRAAKEG